MDKKKNVLTDEEVEQEIARLQGSELVKLAKREERIKTARRRKLYGLRAADIADLPARKRQVNHAATLEVYEDGKRRQVQLKTQKASVTIELADIDKLTGSNKPAKKLFVLALIKANEQAIHDGQLTKNYVSFPLQELIDTGFYSTPQSARKGFNAGMDTLTSLKIKGHTQQTKNKRRAIDAQEVLFTGARIERGQCTIYLNERINWSFIAQYFTILPIYYFRLSNRAYEKRGKLLQEQGVTMESLKKQARELEK